MKFSTCAVIVILYASSAFAVPSLQLYTPGGTYDTSTETWMTNTQSFSLWVAWASHNGHYDGASNLRLDIAVLNPVVPGSYLTITGPGYESGLVITDFTYGTPGGVSTHGIYPALYYSLPLPDMTLAASPEVVKDFVENSGSDMGMVYKYDIALQNVRDVHFDFTAEMLTKKGFTSTFAPYSHDAGAHFSGTFINLNGGGDPVPEPPALFAAAILAAAFFRKRR